MFKKIVVVAGGKDDKNCMFSAEVYYASENKWQTITFLNQERCYFVLTTCEVVLTGRVGKITTVFVCQW